jgi:hypothetical protein
MKRRGFLGKLAAAVLAAPAALAVGKAVTSKAAASDKPYSYDVPGGRRILFGKGTPHEKWITIVEGETEQLTQPAAEAVNFDDWVVGEPFDVDAPSEPYGIDFWIEKPVGPPKNLLAEAFKKHMDMLREKRMTDLCNLIEDQMWSEPKTFGGYMPATPGGFNEWNGTVL